MKPTHRILLFLGILVLAAGITLQVLAAATSSTYLPIVIKPEEPTLTPTPTQTPIQTPTRTPTQSPTPTAPPPVVYVVRSNAFVPYQGANDLYIVGEVRNDVFNLNVRFVQISGTLRDALGNVVDSDFTYAMIDVLTPGMKSPFLMIFLDPPPWATYELAVTWSTTTEQPYPLEILNHTSYFDSSDAYHVVGEIRNQYAEGRTFIEAYVTLYDLDGKVIGVASSFTNPYDLAPGQTASFDTYVYFWKGKPDHNQVGTFSLQVFGD